MNIFQVISKHFQKKQEFHYAHISNLGICKAVFRVEHPLDSVNVIPINALDVSLIGKRWIGNRWTG
jgi:hypothetical protein